MLRALTLPLYRLYRRLTHRPASREALRAYWSAPPETGNLPSAYVTANDGRSELLVELFRRHVPADATVLEIGCNAGRNLAALHRAGYHRVTGVELSQGAVDTLRSTYPELAAVPIHVAGVEDWIGGVPDGSFDAVFTMAVLVHLHDDSGWVFPELARITKRTLVTVEDEVYSSPRHFARDYRRIFQPLGFRDVETQRCTAIAGLGDMYVARVFCRTDHSIDRM